MTERRHSIGRHLRDLVPEAPAFDYDAVLDHAIASRGLRHARPERAAWLSLVAYIRHMHTDYDEMLAEGYDPDSARFFVVDQMNAVLAEWGASCRIDPEEMCDGTAADETGEADENTGSSDGQLH